MKCKKRYPSRNAIFPVMVGLIVMGILSPSVGTGAASGAPGFFIFKNTLHIVDHSFDTMTNAIKVKWTVDTSGAAGALLDVGIFFSTEAYPVVIKGPPDTVKLNTQPEDSVSLLLGNRLLFDTTYYFTLSMKRRIGTWFAATDSSRVMLRTPEFTWQAVQYGIGIPPAYANNARVRISVDPQKFQTVVDSNRIVRWSPPESPAGFIPVSMGFEFYSKYQSEPLNVGVKYGPLPSGYSFSDVKIYRFKNGVWMLDRSTTVLDQFQGYVVVTTGDISYPFIAMLDVQPPTVTVLSHPDKAVVNGKAVADTFSITDNISNVGWRFHYAKAGESFDASVGDSGTLGSSFQHVMTVIQSSFVSADQGVRAMLSVSDGSNEVVRNVSRRVIRNIGGSDVVSLDTMKWVPLCVTAQLDSPEVRQALQVFAVNGQWKYDNTKIRLFRWITGTDKAGKGTGNYREYADECDSLFSFIPGRLMWIKVRKSVVIDFGKGITPELTKSSIMTLRARAWTDFALPFNFNIRIGDIIDATKASGAATDALRFCGWSRDVTNRYSCREFYAPQLGVKELKDLSNIMQAKQNDGTGAGYSVFNQSDIDVDLIIPPLPAVMSKYKGPTFKKTAGDGYPAIKIESRMVNGVFLNDIYCVRANGDMTTRYLPAAPSLGEGVEVRVFDEGMREYGHIITNAGEMRDQGVSCNLVFNNKTDKAETIRVKASGLSNLRAAMYVSGSGAFSDAPSGSEEGWSIHAAAGAQTYCQFFAGDDAYLAKAGLEKKSSKAALIGAYSIAVGHSMLIRFRLPMAPMNRAAFALFDMQGRKIWQSLYHGREGINELVWSGTGSAKRPAAPGAYVLKMTAYEVNGKTAALFEKKLTWLP